MSLEFTEANFQAEVLDSEKPVLVDFWGEGCGPCKMIAPMIDQIAAELDGQAIVGKVDVGANLGLARKLGVRAMPTFLFIRNGEVKEQIVGSNVTKDQLKAKLLALA